MRGVRLLVRSFVIPSIRSFVRRTGHKKQMKNSKMEMKTGGRDPTGHGRDRERKASSVCSIV